MNDLVLNAVSKSFGATKVLTRISLSVCAGQVTAIVGDNGAGKSTLCKTVAGVYHPDEGTIMMGGQRIDGLGPHGTRNAGIEMIYQDLALAKQHDVTSNLFLGREKVAKAVGWLDQKAMREAAIDVLKQIGVDLPRLDRPVGTLSGGQQQSVAIARALLFSPKVLIMDEPTAALAAREIHHILELIARLKDRGLVIILISHRLNDVFAVSDRIITLRNGCIEADKPTVETSMQEVVAQMVGAADSAG